MIAAAIERCQFVGARAFAAVVTVVLSAVLAGCGDDAPQLSRVSPDDVILAFGDSLTFGTGARAEESYPEVLASLINRKVVRSGVPGELSKDGLRRLPGVLEEHRPALVLLCHGGNDLLRKRSVAAATDNIKAMVRLARDAGAQVVLLGVPNPTLILSTAEHYDTIAEDLGLTYVRDAMRDVLAKRDLKSDAAHPNAAGYEQIARVVADSLRQAGAI